MVNGINSTNNTDPGIGQGETKKEEYIDKTYGDPLKESASISSTAALAAEAGVDVESLPEGFNPTGILEYNGKKYLVNDAGQTPDEYARNDTMSAAIRKLGNKSPKHPPKQKMASASQGPLGQLADQIADFFANIQKS